MQVIDVNCT